MNYWQRFKEIQTEELRLQMQVFELTCSIQLLQAEQSQASDEVISTLKASIEEQKREFYKDISYQLFAMAQLKPQKYDN